MSDWTSGYVAEIDYTHGYYPELNPLRATLAFLNAGLVPPEFTHACELGFGQGLGLNLHAAASPIEWHGTDFNPAHAANARELAAISGVKAGLHDEGFDRFCARADLPDFDFIGMHGVWSWISTENRQVLVDFVRRKLKPGGVLFLSYNSLPGWTAMAPMRHLLAEHARVMSPSGAGLLNQVNGALDFSARFLAANPAFAAANPAVVDRLGELQRLNRHYVAHEYFGGHWTPMLFADVAGELGDAKLTYACSAGFQDHVPALSLRAEHSRFLAEIPNPTFRETVRDFLVNQTFRRDYWVKGARTLSSVERAEALRKLRVMLLTAPATVSFKMATPIGEAALQESVYGPIIEALSDLRPRTLGEIEHATAGQGVTLAQIVEAALVLAGRNELAPVQADAAVEKTKTAVARLNAHLADLARSGNRITHLASPLTGGGLQITRFPMLFLLARSQGRTTPEEWAAFVWQILSAQGQKVLRDGRTIGPAEENIAELTRQAALFGEKVLPVLQALRVA